MVGMNTPLETRIEESLASPFLGMHHDDASVIQLYIRSDLAEFSEYLSSFGTNSVKGYVHLIRNVMASYDFLGQKAKINRDLEVLGEAYAALFGHFRADPEHSFYVVAMKEMKREFEGYLRMWEALTQRRVGSAEALSASGKLVKPEGCKAINSIGH